jgi:MFS transporter, ACDE family, multidrug resistance protein
VLAWTPFVLDWGAVAVGLIFFGWGLCIAVAGVVLAPKLAGKLGERHAAAVSMLGYAVLLLVLAVPSKPVVVVGVIVSGLISGLLNTLFTGTAMSLSNAPRPVTSAANNFCRWLGGAAVATLVGHIATWLGSPHTPFVVTAVLYVIAGALLAIRQRTADPRGVPTEAALLGKLEV